MIWASMSRWCAVEQFAIAVVAIFLPQSGWRLAVCATSRRPAVTAAHGGVSPAQDAMPIPGEEQRHGSRTHTIGNRIMTLCL